jgi:hypothetical protein
MMTASINERQIAMRRFTLIALALLIAAPAHADAPDWSKVDAAIGKKGAAQADNVYKVSLPRSDLHVTLDDVVLKPGFALGSHVEFLPMDKGTMVMGDLVLTGEEVAPVMKKLLDGGVDMAALHNHLLRTSPPVYYMHIGGHGDAEKLAAAIHAALLESKTPFGETKKSATEKSDLDTKAIDDVLGRTGKMNNGVYQFSIPRADAVKEADMVIPPAMGVANAINFQSVGGGKAAITGDFALLSKEVEPVMKALTQNGIEVTALHSHMLDDEPRLFFLHFWAKGDASALAKGLKTALDNINIKG